MLGSDRFAFETPNVIDPGELPPSRPQRSNNNNSTSNHSHSHNTQSTTSANSNSDSSSEDSYRAQRQSRARLVNSVSGLDLAQMDASSSNERAYDPYHDDDVDNDGDDVEGGNSRSHSLPNVEEARMFATRMLSPNKKKKKTKTLLDDNNDGGDDDQERTPLSRSLKLPAPGSKHLVRQRVLWLAAKVSLVLVLLIVGVTLSVQLANRKTSNSNSSSSSGSGSSFFPHNNDNNDGNSHGSDREALIAFLGDNNVSDRDALTSAGSPQFLALDWMLNIDPLRYSTNYAIPKNGAAVDANQRLVQRYVLAVLFFSTKGTGWLHSHNFLTPEDECAWFDQEAVQEFNNNQVSAIGVTCDSTSFRVTSIYLPYNNLRGELPNELSSLFDLELLGLPHNQIGGTVPEAMQYNLRLEYVNLNYNVLQGPLPDFFSNYEALQVLGLSNNQFTGALPASWGTMGHIKTFALDDNNLTGSATDVLNKMTSLEFLYMDGNQLTGRIDNQFLSSMPNLQEMDLSHNKFTSADEFPRHLLEHPKLRILDASVNSMAATLPEAINVNLALEFLSLRQNQLRGTLPVACLPHLPKLTHLDIALNNFGGAIPYQIESLESLSYLAMGDNQLQSQEIPNIIFKFTKLRELSLRGLNMTGEIPTFISTLQNLQLLDLSHNNLQGNVPFEVWDLPQLSYLLLDHNQLYGDIPEHMAHPERLLVVTLDHNDIVTRVNPFCEAAENIDVFSLNCDSGLDCTLPCCETCCDSPDCFVTEVDQYLKSFAGMWEFNFQRTSYSFDPNARVDDFGGGGGRRLL